MRFFALAAVLGLAIGLGTGCASRAQPYRFASPLLGNADVPDHLLPDPAGEPDEHAPRRRRGSPAVASRPAAPRRVGGWQADSQQGAIRTVSAHGIETKQPVASAEVASAVGEERYAREVVWSRLPAPHRGSSLPAQPDGLTSAIVIPRIREPSDLRGLVGQRTSREPFTVVLGWLDELGVDSAPYPTDGPTLVSWAATAGKLAPPTAVARPGDLLVFGRAVSDGSADLLAIVIGRDARGVTEFMYAGGGVVRRGFLDPTRPSVRRDIDGSIVNTFLRHVKRFPPRGTRYLTGELLAHVIRTR